MQEDEYKPENILIPAVNERSHMKTSSYLSIHGARGGRELGSNSKAFLRAPCDILITQFETGKNMNSVSNEFEDAGKEGRRTFAVSRGDLRREERRRGVKRR